MYAYVIQTIYIYIYIKNTFICCKCYIYIYAHIVYNIYERLRVLYIIQLLHNVEPWLNLFQRPFILFETEDDDAYAIFVLSITIKIMMNNNKYNSL